MSAPALFVWLQGEPAPVDQRVSDDMKCLPEDLARCRLPERFTIYSHDCPRHVVDLACACKDGTWVESVLQRVVAKQGGRQRDR